MKYTIETTDDGYKEILEYEGNVFEKVWEKTENGYRSQSDEFWEQMKAAGYSTDMYLELLDSVCENIDNFFSNAIVEAFELY